MNANNLTTLTLDTSSWKKSNVEKIAPTGDIWEKDGELYFTWDAAMREAKAQGMRLPTIEEWKEMIDAGWMFPLAGYRYWSGGQYYYQGIYGYYWSSSPYGAYSYSAHFTSVDGSLAYRDNRENGFILRCVKETNHTTLTTPRPTKVSAPVFIPTPSNT